jgi:NAD(P)H dehydrogenase (quinone)
MIFVSGANGQFAHSVIENLLRELEPQRLIVGTRNVGSPYAAGLAGRGVVVREADFRRPEVMRRALEGVDKALIIPTYDTNDVRLQQNLNAIEAARSAGVKHIVYASFLRAESPQVEHSRLVHYPTEQAIRASGLDFTILRHALYADILVGDLHDTLAKGQFTRPGGDARSAYVAREDLGASAARVLLDKGHENRVYSETMERTWSGEEVAELMSEVFGRPIRFQPVEAADWPRYMTENWGVPPAIAAGTIGTMQAVAEGVFDVVTSDYRRITGHPPRTMREFLESVRDKA